MKKNVNVHQHDFSNALIVSIRPLCVKELAEILAIQFDEEVLPTFNNDWHTQKNWSVWHQ
jgi:hypothetical protein